MSSASPVSVPSAPSPFRDVVVRDAFFFLRSIGLVGLKVERPQTAGEVVDTFAPGPQVTAALCAADPEIVQALEVLDESHVGFVERVGEAGNPRVTAVAMCAYYSWFQAEGARVRDPYAKPLRARSGVRTYPVAEWHAAGLCQPFGREDGVSHG